MDMLKESLQIVPRQPRYLKLPKKAVALGVPLWWRRINWAEWRTSDGSDYNNCRFGVRLVVIKEPLSWQPTVENF